ncbi:regulatory protein YcgZ [Escherichia coli]|nr:regulatory protein YcgZ [Escherichia coli]
MRGFISTQQETLGEIVTEILKDGRNLSRKSLCAKLLCRLEQATGEEEQKHYNALIGLLFE